MVYRLAGGVFSRKITHMPAQDFTQEMAAYEAKKAGLLSLCEGKFALFKGDDFAGTFDTSNAAYAEGVKRYGNVPFLIKQIRPVEVVEQFPSLVLGLMYARS